MIVTTQVKVPDVRGEQIHFVFLALVVSSNDIKHKYSTYFEAHVQRSFQELFDGVAEFNIFGPLGFLFRQLEVYIITGGTLSQTLFIATSTFFCVLRWELAVFIYIHRMSPYGFRLLRDQVPIKGPFSVISYTGAILGAER
jgi:hypothetical protein